jgi:hypothetical protein
VHRRRNGVHEEIAGVKYLWGERKDDKVRKIKKAKGKNQKEIEIVILRRKPESDQKHSGLAT